MLFRMGKFLELGSLESLLLMSLDWKIVQFVILFLVPFFLLHDKQKDVYVIKTTVTKWWKSSWAEKKLAFWKR